MGGGSEQARRLGRSLSKDGDGFEQVGLEVDSITTVNDASTMPMQSSLHKSPKDWVWKPGLVNKLRWRENDAFREHGSSMSFLHALPYASLLSRWS